MLAVFGVPIPAPLQQKLPKMLLASRYLALTSKFLAEMNRNCRSRFTVPQKCSEASLQGICYGGVVGRHSPFRICDRRQRKYCL
jgi:hypothetical protein